MATWKNLNTYTYAGSGAVKNNVFVTVQYDADSSTPTSIKIRFRGDNDDTKGKTDDGKLSDTSWTDAFCVLYNADSSNRTTYVIHKHGNKWPCYSSSITLTKAYNATSFTIQDFWFCNSGSVDVSNGQLTYYSESLKRNVTKSVYDWFKQDADRQKYKQIVNSSTLPGKKATDVGTGTTTITDNYNNTFTITATKGANGTNNTAGGPINLKYTYSPPSAQADPTQYNNTYINGNPIKLKISGTNATRRVYAISTTTATYGSQKHAYVKDASRAAGVAIRQYIAPSNPGTPVLSYNKSRLTIKEKWTFKWSAATAANTTSPIKGYRIRLYKNGETIAIKDSSGKSLSWLRAPNSKDYIYDRDGTSTTITINPVVHGFMPGDTVKLSIFAYTKYGLKNDGSKLFSGGGGTAVCSAESTVQNAGVILVKHGDNWVEGQVLVKHKDVWVEAEAVLVKHNDSWKESTS